MTVTHAGVAVQAADTGRILMIQRSLDPTDPPEVQGTWEFPGGGLEDGETPEDGAWREFNEETGMAQPAGQMTGGWTSSDGIYQAFVFTTPTEADAFPELNPDHQTAIADNPDDPGRKAPDVQAWFTVDQIKGLGSALRPEVAAQTDWSQFGSPTSVQAGLRLFAPGVTASATTRTLSGPVVRFGVPGRTSRGLIKVRAGQGAPGARAGLYVLGPVSGVKLTKEHERSESRGHAASIDFLPEGIRASMRASDGPDGDAAIREAADKSRDGFSFDVIDEVIEGDELVEGRIIAIGQVGIPAYDDMRIDSIAASLHNPTNEGARMTPEQIAQLSELLGKETRTPEEDAALQALVALLPAQPADPAVPAVQAAATDPAPVEPTAPVAPVEPAAGVTASIPGGIPPMARPGTTTKPQGANAFETMISGLTQAFQEKRRGGNPLPGITAALNGGGVTAALNDVTSTAHTSDVEPLGWSGQLFDGVAYDAVFSKHLQGAPLTNWEGKGWRFTQTPAMADYAGDKAEIPTGSVGTEDQLYEAARAAVGLDIDRKYFDFPNGDFLSALFEAIAETWTMLVDQKSGLFITSSAVEPTRSVTLGITNGDATVTAAAGTIKATDVGKKLTGTGIPAGTTVLSFTDATHFEMSANATATNAALVAEVAIQSASLIKAAARLSLSLNRRYKGTKAPSSSGPDYIYVNDNDWLQMLDLTELELPAYLKSYGVTPETFIPTEDVPSGFVWGGVDKSAKLRTEARSPIVVDALNLANGGIDKAFYGYWAIEPQHPRGIQKASYSAVVEA